MLKLAITNLSSYTNGVLYFEWLDLDENTENETIQECIDRVLKRGDELGGLSSSQEVFISDYEWDEEEIFSVHEYSDIYALRDKIILLAELEPNQIKSVKFLLDFGIVNDLNEAIEKADDVVCYENSNMKTVAEDFLEQCYGHELENMPTIITSNIDYDSVAYELSISGEYFEVGNDVFQYYG
jgi:hypothetical protein